MKGSMNKRAHKNLKTVDVRLLKRRLRYAIKRLGNRKTIRAGEFFELLLEAAT